MRSSLGAVRLALRAAGRCARTVVESSTRPAVPRGLDGLLRPFREGDRPGTADYEGLFRYFLEGWLTYRLPSGAGARYPGLGSWSGEAIDALQGFSCIAPLWGAWVRGGRRATLGRMGGPPVDLVDLFVVGLTAGTDPDDPAYWGPMQGPSDQRIVEAADVALALWLFGAEAWDRLSAAERDRVMAWLSQVHGRPGLDNNWHLFFVLVDRVQRSFGRPGGDEAEVRRHQERVRSFHLGDGWFEDGPDGPVDYYNAWGFHYLLHWIHRIDPGWDRDFVRPTLEAFPTGFRRVLGPRGFPVLGRSVPYRLAVPAPLVLAQELEGADVPPGQARRALDAVWCHFVRNGAVARGTVTQGYYHDDPRLLDNYAGPATPLWSLRSLVAAFSFAPDSPFWTADPEPLPVEKESYDVVLDPPGWRVTGDRDTGRITLEIPGNAPSSDPGLEPYGLVDRLRAAGHGRPLRPRNEAAKYRRRVYASSGPRCLGRDGARGALESAARRIFPY